MTATLRSYAFTAFLVLTIVVLGVLCLPALLFGKETARRVVQFWARLTLRALKTIAGVNYRVEGRENLPSGGALVAVNHQSMWETIALYALLPRPVVILKKELLRLPIYGLWARATGNIAVDREGGARALKAMRAAARAAIADGEQVVVFPEGTRVEPGQTVRFQPGVAGVYAAAEAPCVPGAHDSGRFWRHPGVQKVTGCITLRMLPPLAPGLDRKEFMAALKTSIENARPDLAVPAAERGAPQLELSS